VVFRWLCQLQLGSYSYDWISHPGRRSPQALVEGLEELHLGQRGMSIFELVEFERGRHLTVRMTFDTREGRLYHRFIDEIVATYLVVPGTAGDCRLVLKYCVRYQAGLAGRAARVLMPWLDLVMSRKQLLNFKGLAERTARGGS
jgi:hypothetical protein